MTNGYEASETVLYLKDNSSLFQTIIFPQNRAICGWVGHVYFALTTSSSKGFSSQLGVESSGHEFASFFRCGVFHSSLADFLSLSPSFVCLPFNLAPPQIPQLTAKVQ